MVFGCGNSKMPKMPSVRRGHVRQDRQGSCQMGTMFGEDVLFAADDAEIPLGNDLMVYREAELRELVGKTPEQLRKIHEVKKKIDGDIRLPDASDFSNGTEE